MKIEFVRLEKGSDLQGNRRVASLSWKGGGNIGDDVTLLVTSQIGFKEKSAWYCCTK